MLRILSFCLVVLLSIGIIIPYANSAHGIRQSTQIGKSANKRHSKAWWRRHRARLRRKRAAELARRHMLLALPKALPVGESASITVPVTSPTTIPANTPANTTVTTQPTSTTVDQASATVKPAMAVPTVASAHTVSNPTGTQPVLSSTSPAELKPKTKNAVKPQPGQMNLAVVALSRPNPAFLTSREEAKMLAGVNVADLRRIVIDKMVVSGGWVTNDFVREVNGGRVFIVTARTPNNGRSPEKVWTFYFTEVAGRIYGLTTDSAVEQADRMTSEAERFITNLRTNPPATNK